VMATVASSTTSQVVICLTIVLGLLMMLLGSVLQRALERGWKSR